MGPKNNQFDQEPEEFETEHQYEIDPKYLGDDCDLHPNETDEEFWDHEDCD